MGCEYFMRASTYIAREVCCTVRHRAKGVGEALFAWWLYRCNRDWSNWVQAGVKELPDPLVEAL
jgi:hypothetical protein